MVRVELQLKPPPAKAFDKTRTGNSLEEIVAKILREYPGHFIKLVGVQEVPGEQGELLKGGGHHGKGT